MPLPNVASADGTTLRFKGYHGFLRVSAPASTTRWHGIPSPKRVIHRGDLLKVDTGAYFEGYHGDSCARFVVRPPGSDAQPRRGSR